MRRFFFWLCIPAMVAPSALVAQPPSAERAQPGAAVPQLQIERQTINPPETPGARGPWLEAMESWRNQKRAEIQYDDAEYARPELLWTQRAFVQVLTLCEDRYLYDPVAGEYTVDRYLDDLDQRYGGVDAVLIWAVYPNIGIDNRNQLDLLGDMPGGISGLRKMTADFHRRDVRVLFPVMPWDPGPGGEGDSSVEAITSLMKEIGADGLFGDTMYGLPRTYRQASDRSGHILALQPEMPMSDDAMIAWNNLSWGARRPEPVPVVNKYKWIEPRHMVNMCERWARDRTNGLHFAFFNGVGYQSWENIWGIWNQFTPRDAEALRRIRTIYRAVADLLVSPDWEPHVPTVQDGVYASRFPGRDRTLWLLVNRTEQDISGEQLALPPEPGASYYDLWHGRPLQPSVGAAATLRFDIEARGFGAVLALHDAEPDENLRRLLTRMAELSATPLARLSTEWKPLPQRMVEIAPTRPADQAPEGMVLVPGGRYHFKMSGVEIEGDDEPGVNVQFPWEDFPRRHHDHELDIKAFYIDRYPVTNAQYKRFLEASGYRPRDAHNFLKAWKDGSFPAGWENKPVTWVALEDARAYAAWAGKRLPHAWEWQYAAQGADGRLYPWGDDPDETAVPPFEDGSVMPPPADVDAHPRGASPFGVMDMTGNVWQWTDEFHDERTRAAVVRGGSRYRPKASDWYFPRNTRLDEQGKYLLMAPSKDRSGMVGFRCVVDAR